MIATLIERQRALVKQIEQLRTDAYAVLHVMNTMQIKATTNIKPEQILSFSASGVHAHMNVYEYIAMRKRRDEIKPQHVYVAWSGFLFDLETENNTGIPASICED